MKRYINSYQRIQNWLGFWRFYYAIKNQEKDNFFSAQMRNGLEVEIPPVLMSAFDEIFLRDVYAMKAWNMPQQPLIIDIGANVGYYSMNILSKFPMSRVIAFEPVPSNFTLLEHHKSINRLDSLVLDKRAVLGDCREIEITYNDSSEFTVGASFVKREGINSTIQVAAVSLPEIFREYEVEHCDLLKIDCEGAEYNILFNCPGHYFRKIGQMVIEVHKWAPREEGTVDKLIGFLEKQGFKVQNKRDEILLCGR